MTKLDEIQIQAVLNFRDVQQSLQEGLSFAASKKPLTGHEPETFSSSQGQEAQAMLQF